MSKPAHLVGLISDTHGLVRADVHAALAGVELILHAGDVGGVGILQELRLIAPVLAVRGNTDPPDDPQLAEIIDREIGGLRIHVSHGHELGPPLNPTRLLERYDADVIVFGHTHRETVLRVGNRLVVNPGAAGPRRFKLLPSVGRLAITDGHAEVELVPLAP